MTSRERLAAFLRGRLSELEREPEGPLSAKVMACTSCHSDSGFTFELVEASATLDLLQAFCGDRKQGRSKYGAKKPKK